MRIQLIFAEQENCYWSEFLELPESSTIAQALELSTFAQSYPEWPILQLKVGIFGQKYELNHALTSGDRVEIYRSLTFDPKVSRKRRALHRKTGILKKKHLKPDRSKRVEYDEHTQETL